MRNLDHLKLKGWKRKEITHALKVLKKAEEKKHPALKTLEMLSFWINLFVIVIASILFAALSTSMVYLTEYLGYGITALVALVIGSLFISTFDHLDKIEMHHHIVTGIVIFIVAMASYVLASSATNRFITDIVEIQSRTYNPWLLGLCYTIFFLIPYTYHIWHDNYIKQKTSHP
jgi:hypothetical protein